MGITNPCVSTRVELSSGISCAALYPESRWLRTIVQAALRCRVALPLVLALPVASRASDRLQNRAHRQAAYRGSNLLGREVVLSWSATASARSHPRLQLSGCDSRVSTGLRVPSNRHQRRASTRQWLRLRRPLSSRPRRATHPVTI